MSPIIRIQNLGKKYRLGETHARSLRDLVNTTASRLFGSRGNSRRSEPDGDANDFWALQNISLEIQPGQVVGVIGRNGAGKSTLLKILSNIVTPTTGRIELYGRVASLLEVGTGFHPELTGRENVFLNGTILGMTKAQVRQRFDEIVAFAGVDTFIDTPVKRYSSGMTVRLAFAVAAFLESEILIIDEVLAVGDVEFQRKCLGRMQAVSESGRTVLFVSHNMPSVRALTTRSIVLSRGKLHFDGATPDAIDQYVQENTVSRTASQSVAERDRPFDGLSSELRFESLEVEQLESFVEGSEIPITVTIRGHRSSEDFAIGLTVFREDEAPVGNAFSSALAPPPPGELISYRLAIPAVQLAPGRYHCAISIVEARSLGQRMQDSLRDVLAFEVEPGPLRSQHWPAGWGPIRFPEMRLLSATTSASSSSPLLTGRE